MVVWRDFHARRTNSTKCQKKYTLKKTPCQKNYLFVRNIAQSDIKNILTASSRFARYRCLALRNQVHESHHASGLMQGNFSPHALLCALR